MVAAGALLAGLWALWTPVAGGTREATVYVLDVGQGDAILVVSRGHALLVDAGPPGSGVASRLPPLLQGASLDLVVATHADGDHAGGLQDVLRSRPRATFREPGQRHTSGTWASLLAYLGTRPPLGLEGHDGRWWIGDVAATLVPAPDQRLPGNANENGLLVLLTIGPWRVLLPGDAGAPREERLLASGALVGHLPVHLLGLGHHGSASASTVRWLDRLAPVAAFCSAGQENRHGHPHPAVLDRLRSREVRVDCTDREGTLRYRFGERLQIVTDRHPIPVTIAASP
ncbi:MBL fold metallo-hydrolase [bacterium]|nr:MBL fold metallo-hydrolase [bacterium]